MRKACDDRWLHVYFFFIFIFFLSQKYAKLGFSITWILRMYKRPQFLTLHANCMYTCGGRSLQVHFFFILGVFYRNVRSLIFPSHEFSCSAMQLGDEDPSPSYQLWGPPSPSNEDPRHPVMRTPSPVMTLVTFLVVKDALCNRHCTATDAFSLQ